MTSGALTSLPTIAWRRRPDGIVSFSLSSSSISSRLSSTQRLSGSKTPEIDIVLNEAKEARGEVESPDDRLPRSPAHGQAISRPADLWRLGPHRLLCGNALEKNSYARLLEGCTAEMVITDPPFNVKIEGNVGGLGRIRHPDFAMASGEMSAEQFTSFLSTAFSHMEAHSADGALSFVFMDWRHLREILDAGEKSFSELKNVV